MMLSNHLISAASSFLPSIFPSIRVFPRESAFQIRWPNYWRFNFSILPVNIHGWFPLGLTRLIVLLSKGLSRIFSSTTIWKHQFFGAQPSFWFNSHIHTWLLEKPFLWLYGPLSAKWWLCFLIGCLGLTSCYINWITYDTNSDGDKLYFKNNYVTSRPQTLSSRLHKGIFPRVRAVQSLVHKHSGSALVKGTSSLTS